MSNSPFYFFLSFISLKKYFRCQIRVILELCHWNLACMYTRIPYFLCPWFLPKDHILKPYFNQNTSIIENFKKVISLVIELTNRKKNQWEILWNCNNLKFKCHVSKPYWSRQYFVLFYWIRTLIRIIFIHCHW